MLPEITVLMSVYNGEKYLRQSIESVLNQTYKNFEFLIINDCSSDTTLDIINSYKDKRIKIINNLENMGLTKSLNKGLNVAKGKYIARIDADDYWELNKLEIQYKFIKKKKYDVVGTYADVINSKSEKIGLFKPEVNNSDIKINLLFSNQLVHSSVMFIKKKILKLNSYNEKMKYAQDYELWLRCMSNNLNFYNIPIVLVNYRRHNNSISFDKNNEQENYVQFFLSKFYFNIFKSTKNILFIKEIRGLLKKSNRKISVLEFVKIQIYLFVFMISLFYSDFSDNIIFNEKIFFIFKFYLNFNKQLKKINIRKVF